MPDIQDATNSDAQKIIDDAAKNAGAAPSPAQNPAGIGPAPISDTPPSSLPPEPGPEPIAPLIEKEAPPKIDQSPSDQAEQSPQDTSTREAVVDEILNAPTAAEQPPTPTVTVPAISTEPPPPAKKSKTGRIITTLVLFLLLTAIPIGVYINSQRQQIAEIRNQATNCISARECSPTGSSCRECPGYVKVGTRCCLPEQPGGGGGGGGNPPSPTPTRTPAVVNSPCLYCGGTNGTCTRSAFSGCNNSLNECQTVGSTNECGGFVPTGCTEDGEIPTGRKPCCQNLSIGNGGRCRPFQTTPTPPPAQTGCSQVKCTSTSCTVGDMYDGGGASNCVVWHYKCPNDWPQGKGCQENGTAGKSGSFSGCGTEQVDIYCPACGIGAGTKFISKFNQGSCAGGNQETPACTGVKIYKGGAVVTDYSTLHAGDQVVIAVSGGLATKAHIRVNGGPFEETSTKNANNEYVKDFTIPEAVTDFTIESEIFGTDGNWH